MFLEQSTTMMCKYLDRKYTMYVQIVVYYNILIHGLPQKFPNFIRADGIGGIICINKAALSSLKFRSQML